jgi:hypothetical protein
MKQIDKLAWIEIKIKNTFHQKFWKRQILYSWWKREVNETDLEALTRDKEELSVDLEANSLQFIGVLKRMPTATP